MRSQNFLLLFSALVAMMTMMAPQVCLADESSWPRALAPVGSLPAGAEVQVKPAPSQGEVFANSSSPGGPLLESHAASKYSQVTSLKASSLSAADKADLQTEISQNRLYVENAQLKAATAGCDPTQGACVLTQDVESQRAMPYEPTAFYRDMMSGPGLKASEAGAAEGQDGDPARLAAEGADRVLGRLNRPGGVADQLANNWCPPEQEARASSFFDFGAPSMNAGAGRGFFWSSGRPPACAIQKAQAHLGRHRDLQDVMIVNDFSDGGVTGKMWFLKADGSLANVGVPNPIPVSRGSGGFGRGVGSQRTPDGAICAIPTGIPRAGNIKDGIELKGLEGSKNNDIHSRGVLLHGWNPNQPTSGCLGIQGTLTTAKASYPAMGGASHFDRLRQTLLSRGKTLIYNFTPDEAKACGGS